MSIRTENLHLTIDVAALQRLPEVSPTPEGAVMLGAAAVLCSIEGPTCCCTRFSVEW